MGGKDERRPTAGEMPPPFRVVFVLIFDFPGGEGGINTGLTPVVII